MSTITVVLSTDWVNVTTQEALAANQIYSVQNVGNNAVWFYKGATPPAELGNAHVLYPSQAWNAFKQPENEFLFFKVQNNVNQSGRIAITEAIDGGCSGGGTGGTGKPAGNDGDVQYKFDDDNFGGIPDVKYSQQKFIIGQYPTGQHLVFDEQTATLTIKNVRLENCTIVNSLIETSTIQTATLTNNTYNGGIYNNVNINSGQAFDFVVNEVRLQVVDARGKEELFVGMKGKQPVMSMLEDTIDYLALNENNLPDYTYLVDNLGRFILTNNGKFIILNQP